MYNLRSTWNSEQLIVEKYELLLSLKFFKRAIFLRKYVIILQNIQKFKIFG